MKGSPSALGVIPLAMRHVFQHIRACRDHEFLLRMSYIEIYNGRRTEPVGTGVSVGVVMLRRKRRVWLVGWSRRRTDIALCCPVL